MQITSKNWKSNDVARAMGNHQTEEQLRAFLAEYPADLRRKVQEMRQALQLREQKNEQEKNEIIDEKG